MIKKLVFFSVLTGALLLPTPRAQAANPWAAIIKAAIKKVVRAVDLMIQRRQNRVIKLQNAQKAIENVMSKLQLEQIASWVRKQRDLYKQYYDELKKVKAVISYYFAVKDIAAKQLLILESYQRAWNLFQSDNHFSAAELLHMAQVYEGMLAKSAQNVDLLGTVVKSFALEMSDAARLGLITEASRQIDQVASELTRFNEQNVQLSLSRARSEFDARVIKALYGIQ